MLITFQKLFWEYGYSLKACPKLQKNGVDDLLFMNFMCLVLCASMLSVIFNSWCLGKTWACMGSMGSLQYREIVLEFSQFCVICVLSYYVFYFRVS